MFVDENNYNKFEEYMYENIGKNINISTKKYYNSIDSYLIDKIYIDVVENLICKYKLVDYNIFNDVSEYNGHLKRSIDELENKERYFVFRVFIQYDNNNSTDEKKFNKLYDDLYDISTFSSRASATYRDLNEFKNLKIGQCVSYFIVDESNSSSAKQIIEHITKKEVSPVSISLKNDEFEINNLVYFKVENNFDVNKKVSGYISYDILCMLLDAEINHCIYSDRDGELRPLDIRMKKASNRISNVGFRKDLGIVFRSTWEANFARILNYLNINWKYESEWFDLKSDYFTGSYCPDFILDDNVIIEVKGFWDSYSRKKVKCFKANFKQYRLLTLDSDIMNSLCKLYSDKIENWEECDIANSSHKIHMVGINIPSRKKYNQLLQVGDSVKLVREKDNIYDGNAIKVLDNDKNMLGYISAEWSSIFSDKMDIGIEYDATVSDKAAKVITLDVKMRSADSNIVYEFLKK